MAGIINSRVKRVVGHESTHFRRDALSGPLMNHIAALGRSVIAALRPAKAPWVVGPAVWAMAKPTRDEAYRLAHQLRAGAEAAVLKPPPVSAPAAQAIPATMELEDVMDAITAIRVAVDGGCDAATLIDDVADRLARLDQSALARR